MNTSWWVETFKGVWVWLKTHAMAMPFEARIVTVVVVVVWISWKIKQREVRHKAAVELSKRIVTLESVAQRAITHSDTIRDLQRGIQQQANQISLLQAEIVELGGNPEALQGRRPRRQRPAPALAPIPNEVPVRAKTKKASPATPRESSAYDVINDDPFGGEKK